MGAKKVVLEAVGFLDVFGKTQPPVAQGVVNSGAKDVTIRIDSGGGSIVLIPSWLPPWP